MTKKGIKDLRKGHFFQQHFVFQKTQLPFALTYIAFADGALFTPAISGLKRFIECEKGS